MSTTTPLPLAGTSALVTGAPRSIGVSSVGLDEAGYARVTEELTLTGRAHSSGSTRACPSATARPVVRATKKD